MKLWKMNFIIKYGYCNTDLQHYIKTCKNNLKKRVKNITVHWGRNLNKTHSSVPFPYKIHIYIYNHIRRVMSYACKHCRRLAIGIVFATKQFWLSQVHSYKGEKGETFIIICFIILEIFVDCTACRCYCYWLNLIQLNYSPIN